MKRKLPSIKPRLAPVSTSTRSGDGWRDGRSSSTARGYTYAWQVARLEYLEANPLCVHCAELGIIESATVVDHKRPHRGDMVLFWNRSNWQGLCKTCHDAWKQRQEAAQRNL